MKPTIRYELKHGDMLTFGDVKCQYVVDLDTEEVKLYVHCEACLTELGKPTRDCKVGLYQQWLIQYRHKASNLKKAVALSCSCKICVCFLFSNLLEVRSAMD